MKKLKEISDRMKDQDNRMTADPIFLVQQRKHIFGMDLDYVDDVAWIFDSEYEYYYGDTNPEFLEALVYYGENYEMPENWTRTGYIDIWEFVQPFFSLKAAEDISTALFKGALNFEVSKLTYGYDHLGRV